jgi:hypothetical protein
MSDLYSPKARARNPVLPPYLLVYRSRKEANHPIGGGKLDNFEKLIRDAIALLIKRGEIKIP